VDARRDGFRSDRLGQDPCTLPLTAAWTHRSHESLARRGALVVLVAC
jgi:hypothetical protein